MVDVTELSGDEKLLDDGWERRSILDEPRLSEVVRMYKDMGLEVRVVDLDPAVLVTCDTCLTGSIERYKVVYTRGEVSETDDLFA